ncbi:MAG: FHA domain-containing protein [Planctomycetaceae bacterium]|nr:FHA domain-containing protein [Planctomycetaceae bacterium]
MKLELISSDPNKSPIVLKQFPVIVGLDPGADVCLDDSSLGHYQCMIDDSDGELTVWDLGTRSGTFVNRVRVSPKAPLLPGDELAFGKHRFEARYGVGLGRPGRAGSTGRDRCARRAVAKV